MSLPGLRGQQKEVSNMSEEEYLLRYASKEIQKLRVFEVMRYEVDCGQCGQDPTYQTKEFS